MKFWGNRDFRQHHMLAITLLRLGISGFLLLTPSITATELAVRVRNPSFECYDQILSHNLPDWQKNMLLVSNKSGNLKCFQFCKKIMQSFLTLESFESRPHFRKVLILMFELKSVLLNETCKPFFTANTRKQFFHIDMSLNCGIHCHRMLQRPKI